MKKKTLWLLVVLVGILVFGAVAYFLFFVKGIDSSKTLTQDNFVLTYTYQGENRWDYTVTGTLPTPCYAVNTDATVMESYPEQVQITVSVQEEPTDGVCSTVIQNYSYEGTFSASKLAKISFNVE